MAREPQAALSRLRNFRHLRIQQFFALSAARLGIKEQKMKAHFRLILLASAILWLMVPVFSEEILMQNASTSTAMLSPSWMNNSTAKLQKELIEKNGSSKVRWIARVPHT